MRYNHTWALKSSPGEDGSNKRASNPKSPLFPHEQTSEHPIIHNSHCNFQQALSHSLLSVSTSVQWVIYPHYLSQQLIPGTQYSSTLLSYSWKANPAHRHHSHSCPARKLPLLHSSFRSLWSLIRHILVRISVQYSPQSWKSSPLVWLYRLVKDLYVLWELVPCLASPERRADVAAYDSVRDLRLCNSGKDKTWSKWQG